ncbi:GNAT family N-acetyltransferase [Streptomyces sp. NPDC050509]|uniref:GNAT family N-acetyltransferase n=1 Tax=Streptomyces sp. NPDC050509 TaxID=3365620 RepID=UPI00379C6179
MDAETRTAGARTTGQGIRPPRLSPWRLRAATAADVEPVAELRATVMRADLERLGRYDEHRVRQRLRDSFSTEHTSIIVTAEADDADADAGEGAVAGCLTLRPTPAGLLLEHFYLAPHHQGHGLGSAVLRTVLRRADERNTPVRLNVLQGSAARRLYERHGFVLESEDLVDVFMLRPPRA